MSKFQYHKGVLDPETGWMITPQEAYLPEEWEEHKRVCRVCDDEFVVYTPDDADPKSGRPASYCSEQCRREAHRRESAAWVAKHREYSREYARKQREKRMLEGSHAAAG